MQKYRLSAIRKFYLLDYFYVVLKSIEQEPQKGNAFEVFKRLKQEHKLGESKYRKLKVESSVLSKTQERRFFYTFEQVIFEAKLYDLIQENDEKVALTVKGRQGLRIYQEHGISEFNRYLLPLMEGKYHAFHSIITFCYAASRDSNGLLILPNYSPLRLGYERSSLSTVAGVEDFISALSYRLERDVRQYLKKSVELSNANLRLLNSLRKASILSKNRASIFEQRYYNALLNRIRKFWLAYFLIELYNFQYSLQTFDIWTYRGKQFGLLQATEFFPGFSGKVVYPTSVIKTATRSDDFVPVFNYENSNLYIHEPKWESAKDDFLNALTESYFQVKRTDHSVFVSMSQLKELVCFKLRINEQTFSKFLEKAYHLNLAGQLRIGISLEADRLPEETNAMYLKREPVSVDGKQRNIIAISVSPRSDK